MLKNKSILGLISLLAFMALVNSMELFAQNDFVYDAKGKRNPFIPLVTPDGKFIKLDTDEEGEKKGLKLEGIIYDKSGISFALINGNSVKTGDFVEDFQVLKIEKNRVILIKEGITSEIEIKKGEAE